MLLMAVSRNPVQVDDEVSGLSEGPWKLLAGGWGGVQIPEFCSHIYCNLSLRSVKMRTINGCFQDSL